MLVIGLTGGIATGKSTVSSLLASPPYSLPIIDADLIARQVVEPGTPSYAAIVSHFLSTTPDLLLPASPSMPPNGPLNRGRPLNRPALGRRVFGDDDRARRDRAVLNGIVHPAVRREMLRQAALWYLRGRWAVVLDVPLLCEARLDRFCGTTIVVVVTDEEAQLGRLMARDAHLSEEEARDRIASQEGVLGKAERCRAMGGVVLVNDGTREELERILAVEMERLGGGRPWWWGGLMWFCPLLAAAVGGWTVWRNMRGERAWEEERKRK